MNFTLSQMLPELIFCYPALLALTLVKFSVPMFRQLNGIKNLLFLSDKFVLNDKLG
jgi:hypothetical protein